MKTNYFNLGKVALIAVLALITGSIQAQRGYGLQRGYNSQRGYGIQRGYGLHLGYTYGFDSLRAVRPGLNLTEEQQDKISELRTAHLNEVQSLRDDLNIKEAELRKYQNEDNPNISTINKTIDEIGDIRSEIMKKNAAHQVEVQNLLTDEQKALNNTRGAGYGRFNKGRGVRGLNGGRLGRGLR